MESFQYGRDFHHERVKKQFEKTLVVNLEIIKSFVIRGDRYMTFTLRGVYGGR